MVTVTDKSTDEVTLLDARSENSSGETEVVQFLSFKEKNSIEYSICKCDSSDNLLEITPKSKIYFITMSQSNIRAYLWKKTAEYITGWNGGKKCIQASPEELEAMIPDFHELVTSIYDCLLKTPAFQAISKEF